MSDNWLNLIPTDPYFQPSKDAAVKAQALLELFILYSEEISTVFSEHVDFYHPCGNWDGVKCPVCGQDIESWWEETVIPAAADHFPDLIVTTPCCGTTQSLNDLHYPWPAGFARFALRAWNPEIEDLKPAQLAALESALGHKLRKIWVHL